MSRASPSTSATDEVGNFGLFETKNIEHAVGKYFNKYIDYIMLLGGIISIMENMHLCEDCQFCNTVREVRV
jgi:hypothetical protein